MVLPVESVAELLGLLPVEVAEELSNLQTGFHEEEPLGD
jgi:hypothetical protein